MAMSRGAARASISFAPMPDTITEAINRAACGVIWHSTGQKPRDECHRTDDASRERH